jgi:SAM-dependent methyltransferase
MPGIHDFVESYLLATLGRGFPGVILDAGSGPGAFTWRLQQQRFPHLVACDMHPELFAVDGVECRQADVTRVIPWRDASLDVVLLLEVTEHIDGLTQLFKETHRVLKPGGRLIFTTPNILSIKSRLRFFWTGYPYSFSPLYDTHPSDVWAHINPLTLDQYILRLRGSGLRCEMFTTDKWQRSSLFGLMLYPLIHAYTRLIFGPTQALTWQNSLWMLLGRILLVDARKEGKSSLRWPLAE